MKSLGFKIWLYSLLELPKVKFGPVILEEFKPVITDEVNSVVGGLSSVSCILDFYHLLKSSGKWWLGQVMVNVYLQKGVILSALKETDVLYPDPSEQMIAVTSFVPNGSGQFSSNL